MSARARCLLRTALRPLAVGRRRAVARRLQDRLERGGRRGEHLGGAAAVVAQLGGAVGDAHEARLAEHRRRAVGELEVEAAADGDDDVGLAHHRAAHRGDDRGMVLGDQAAALAGVEVERVEPLEQPAQRLAGAARAAAGDEQRPARRPQQLDRLGHRRRVGQRVAHLARLEQLGQLHRSRHLAAQRVDREVEVDRAGLAALPQRARHRLVELLRHQRRLAHGAGVARQRPHELDVRHVLQRAAVLLLLRRRARQHQHRGARHAGVGDAGHGVGDAGAGGDQRHAEPAGEVGVRMRHVDRGALVAHVDDADALGVEPHPDRHDVAAAQAEHPVDAARLQEAGDHRRGAVFGNGNHAHGSLLVRCGRRRGAGRPWVVCVVDQRKPIEIQGTATTTARPTSSASM